MQEYSIVISDAAATDLQNIYNYVRSVSSTYDAQTVLKRIQDKVFDFRFAPERTEPFTISRHGLSLRATISGKYRIIYAVNRMDKEVAIVRVISTGQDPKYLLTHETIS